MTRDVFTQATLGDGDFIREAGVVPTQTIQIYTDGQNTYIPGDTWSQKELSDENATIAQQSGNIPLVYHAGPNGFVLAGNGNQLTGQQAAIAQGDGSTTSLDPPTQLAPPSTAPENAFGYNPGPRGFVIQQDGPLLQKLKCTDRAGER